MTARGAIVATLAMMIPAGMRRAVVATLVAILGTGLPSGGPGVLGAAALGTLLAGDALAARPAGRKLPRKRPPPPAPRAPEPAAEPAAPLSPPLPPAASPAAPAARPAPAPMFDRPLPAPPPFAGTIAALPARPPASAGDLELAVHRARALLEADANRGAAAAFFAIVHDPAYAAHAGSVDANAAWLGLARGSLRGGDPLGGYRAAREVVALGPKAPLWVPALRTAVDAALACAELAPDPAADLIAARADLGALVPQGVPPEVLAELSYLAAKAEVAALTPGSLGLEVDGRLAGIPPTSRLWAPSRYLRGLAKVKEGDLPGAAELFHVLVCGEDGATAALYADGRAPGVRDLARLALARIRFEQGKFRAAIRLYDDVPLDSPYAAEALHELAWAWYELGEPDSAAAVARELLRSDPQGPWSGPATLALAHADLARCELASARRGFAAAAGRVEALLGELERSRADGAAGPELRTALSRMPAAREAALRARSAAFDAAAAARAASTLARAATEGGAAGATSGALDAPAVPASSTAGRAAAGAGKRRAALLAGGLVGQALRLRAAALASSAPDLAAQEALVAAAGALAIKGSQLEAALGDSPAAALLSATRGGAAELEPPPPAPLGDSSATRGGAAELEPPSPQERTAAAPLSAALAAEARAAAALVPFATAAATATRSGAIEARAAAALGARAAEELAESRLGEIDATLSQKELLQGEIRALARGEVPAELLGAAAAAGFLRPDQEFWPFEGEHWPDELRADPQ